MEWPPGTSPEPIAEVTLWAQGDEAVVAQLPAPGGAFEVWVPAGSYRVRCRAPGFEPVELRTEVPAEGELRCALR